MKKTLSLLLGLSLATAPIYAQVLVQSPRFDELKGHHSGSVYSFKREDFETYHDTSVQEFLQRSSSFSLSQQGAAGGSSSAFLRGQDASSLAVYIDGVLVNDPTNPSRSFDFGHLSLSGVQEIKVYQGPQTVLHGASALGGVISITTLKAQKESKGQARYQFERYSSHDAHLNYQSKTSHLRWALGLNHKKSEGPSSAQSAARGAPTPDGREFNQAQLSVQAQSWSLKGRYQKDRFDLDGFDSQTSLPVDAPGDSGEDEQWQLSSRWQNTLSNQVWADYLFSFKSSKRQTTQAGDISRFQGQSWQLKLDHQWQQSSKWSSYFGLQSFLEKAIRPLDQSRKTSGLYWLQHYENKGLIVSAGARLESHQSFGETSAFSASVSQELSAQHSLKYNFSTSFRAPSLSELFDPQYGNPELEPETSQHHELGWSFLAAQNLQLQSSLFTTQTRSRLSFDNQSLRSVNKGRSAIYGVEFKTDWKIPDHALRVQAEATLLKAYDLETGADLLRRPRQKWSVNLNQKLSHGLTLNSGLTWVSKRHEFNGPTLPQYTQIDLILKYMTPQGPELWSGVENIFDEPNSGSVGYTPPGVVWSLGLAASF